MQAGAVNIHVTRMKWLHIRRMVPEREKAAAMHMANPARLLQLFKRREYGTRRFHSQTNSRA